MKDEGSKFPTPYRPWLPTAAVLVSVLALAFTLAVALMTGCGPRVPAVPGALKPGAEFPLGVRSVVLSLIPSGDATGFLDFQLR